MQQCRKTFGLILETLISKYEPKDEWRIPGWLITIQERKFFVQKLVMDKFLVTSHFCFSLSSFCPTQGHPTEAFGTYSNMCPTNWIKERFNQGAMQMCPFTCSCLYSLDFLLFDINPQHQPLIESNTTRTHSLP
jgi:hypothetical protein